MDPVLIGELLSGLMFVGIIGFLLDRVMYALQSMFTFSNNR